jgi:hypothetical protein
VAVNIYRVVGPLKIHRTREAGGRVISSKDVKRFWDQNSKHAKRVGRMYSEEKRGKAAHLATWARQQRASKRKYLVRSS